MAFRWSDCLENKPQNQTKKKSLYTPANDRKDFVKKFKIKIRF